MRSSRGNSDADGAPSIARRFLKPYSHPTDAFLDRDLAKLGDALLNLIYSLSLSISEGEPRGRKLPNSILSKALETSRHADLIPRRSDRHRRGDIVEAALAYAWLIGGLSIAESARMVAKEASKGEGTHSERYSRAFSRLIDDTLDDLGIDSGV